MTIQWLPFAILAGISFGVYNFFTKITADKFSPIISLAILTGTAFIMSLIGIAILSATKHTLLFDKNSLHKPILGGIFYGIAVIFNLIMLSKGTPLSLGNPFVSAVLTVMITMLSLLFLHESLNITRIAGLILATATLFVLSRS